MQNNQNLWIGLIIGCGLTGLLMYVLSQQADPFNATQTVTKTSPTMTTPFVASEPTESAQTEPAKSEIAEPKVAQPHKIDLPGLPENPRLPEKELAELSAEEREKYEKVLATYQQVRDKVLRLHQEREQLEQQINRIIEENTTVDQQLDKMKANQKNN